MPDPEVILSFPCSTLYILVDFKDLNSLSSNNKKYGPIKFLSKSLIRKGINVTKI